MNYDLVKTRLETAHSVLIQTGEDLDLHELGSFPDALRRKDWRGALAILEECGAATDVADAFWRELLEAARELELPRYLARLEKRVRS